MKNRIFADKEMKFIYTISLVVYTSFLFNYDT